MNTPENPNENGGSDSSENSTGDKLEGRFETLKIYLKDASFESPLTPAVFATPSAEPKFESQLGLDVNTVDEKQGVVEIVLKITITSEHDGQTLFLAEVQQAGIFQLVHPDVDKRQLVMEVTCPHILLPFAREELNSLITKGGFSPFLMAPVNFEALYRAKGEQGKTGEPEPATERTEH
jgi:preprotein translocase subunit SecB